MSAKLLDLTRNFVRFLETRRRDAMATLNGGALSRQIIFMHVPKCAGTSVKACIKSCVGSKRAGRRVKITENSTDFVLSETDVARARAARFVYGGMSWQTLERIRRDDAASTFTVLRDPEKRLMSLYHFLRRHPGDYKSKTFNPIFFVAAALSPADFFGSPEPIVRSQVDNAMVRQFAGSHLAPIPATEDEWRMALDTAKRNILSLSHVAFTGTLHDDLVEILRAAGLPVMVSMPRLNGAGDDGGDATRNKVASDPTGSPRLRAALEPLVRWDRELYEFASSAFRRETPPPSL